MGFHIQVSISMSGAVFDASKDIFEPIRVGEEEAMAQSFPEITSDLKSTLPINTGYLQNTVINSLGYSKLHTTFLNLYLYKYTYPTDRPEIIRGVDQVVTINETVKKSAMKALRNYWKGSTIEINFSMAGYVKGVGRTI